MYFIIYLHFVRIQQLHFEVFKFDGGVFEVKQSLFLYNDLQINQIEAFYLHFDLFCS